MRLSGNLRSKPQYICDKVKFLLGGDTFIFSMQKNRFVFQFEECFNVFRNLYTANLFT